MKTTLHPKNFFWSRFQEWYASQIVDQLEEDTQHVDMRPSIMKPLGAHWLVAVYDYSCANPTFIVNGLSKADTSDILSDWYM